MNGWEFANNNPITSIILAMVLAHIIYAPFKYGFRAWNRALRSRNIRAQGWPPVHVDADGDAIEKCECDETEQHSN